MHRRHLLAALGSVSILSCLAAAPAVALQLGEASEPHEVDSSLPKPDSVPFSPETSYPTDLVIGYDTAPVTIVEYASLTCPHCANFHNTVYGDLKKALIDTGKVKFVYRHFPLDNLAALGAASVSCLPVASQPAAISSLFKSLMSQEPWVAGKSFDAGIGKVFGDNLAQAYKQDAVEACLKDENRIRDIMRPSFDAQKANAITGTPFFFINGVPYSGPRTVEDFTKAVDEAALKI